MHSCYWLTSVQSFFFSFLYGVQRPKLAVTELVRTRWWRFTGSSLGTPTRGRCLIGPALNWDWTELSSSPWILSNNKPMELVSRYCMSICVWMDLCVCIYTCTTYTCMHYMYMFWTNLQWIYLIHKILIHICGQTTELLQHVLDPKPLGPRMS